jgi:hypothetical protein
MFLQSLAMILSYLVAVSRASVYARFLSLRLKGSRLTVRSKDHCLLNPPISSITPTPYHYLNRHLLVSRLTYLLLRRTFIRLSFRFHCGNTHDHPGKKHRCDPSSCRPSSSRSYHEIKGVTVYPKKKPTKHFQNWKEKSISIVQRFNRPRLVKLTIFEGTLTTEWQPKRQNQ